MTLTDEERAILRRRLGAAHVELVPLDERYRLSVIQGCSDLTHSVCRSVVRG